MESSRRPVLVICYANICRSPLAEVLLRRELRDRGLAERFSVSSAGFLSEGHEAHPYSRECARARGLDLTDHSSRVLTPARVPHAWRVLAMEESLAERARKLGAHQAFALAPWATLGEDTADVGDPIGRDLDAFEACARRLEALMPRAVDRMVLEADQEDAQGS